MAQYVSNFYEITSHFFGTPFGMLILGLIIGAVIWAVVGERR